MVNASYFLKRSITMVLLAAILVCSFASTMVTPVSAATCGNWATYSAGESFCSSDGCGFLWLSETNYQYLYQKHTCLEMNNNTYNEYRSVLTKLGCC